MKAEWDGGTSGVWFFKVDGSVRATLFRRADGSFGGHYLAPDVLNLSRSATLQEAQAAAAHAVLEYERQIVRAIEEWENCHV